MEDDERNIPVLKNILAVATASACYWSLNASAVAQSNMPTEPAFPNLSFINPVDLQHAGDGSNRIFVVEQRGVILVFENRPDVENGAVFLDIRDRVNSGGEEGLLGLAFHPDYRNNGFFYVNYTAASPRRTVVSRFTASPDPDIADAANEKIILTFEQPFSNHNGGQIAFGPDGYLYIATGDGGSGGDPQGNGQNRRNLLGKILRIDVDKTSGGREYSIPADNPLANNDAGFREEIFAWGLRNPWRFSFDARTGRLWTGDVGQNRFEEINIIEKGKNYGWNVMEGSQCFQPPAGCDTAGLVKPVAEYGRSLGVSVTGGYVYYGVRNPELKGKYIYGDFGSGSIWALSYEEGGSIANEQIASSGLNISSFGMDETGELYICAFNGGGGIHRFKPGATGISDRLKPAYVRLDAPYPHPVGESGALISFSLAEAANVRIVLTDALGREAAVIAEHRFDSGVNRVKLDGGRLPPGTYFLRLSAAGVTLTRPVVLD